MADEKNEEEEAPKGGGGNKKLIIGLVAFNVLAAGGVGYVVMSDKGSAEAAPPAAAEGAEGAEGEAAAEPAAAPAPPPLPPGKLFGPMVEMKPIVGNLDDPQAGRYVKVTVHLEIASEELRGPVEEAMVPIRSAIIVYFTGVKVDDTIGSENRERIALELLSKLSTVVGRDVIKRVFFAEFVTQ